jgi:phosphate starvation-inducible PhoH-like protein
MVKKKTKEYNSQPERVQDEFTLDFLNPSQEVAWRKFQQSDLLFLLGAAGTGKSHLATGFAIKEVLQGKREKIVITRPVVEAGESLGFLPGDLNEKINPYMMPIYDCMKKIVGNDSGNKDKIKRAIDVVPLAYMRGRTFSNAIFILDEAQNCSYTQLKLAISRLGYDSKMIVTGDPQQSDLPGEVSLVKVVDRLRSLNGVGVMEFSEEDVVRHSLVARILKKL